MSMETKKTREFVIGVLPEGMVTILGNEIFKPFLSDFGALANKTKYGGVWSLREERVRNGRKNGAITIQDFTA